MSRETLLDEAIAKAKEAEDWQLVEWLRMARGGESAARWYTAKLGEARLDISKLMTENAKLIEFASAMYRSILLVPDDHIPAETKAHYFEVAVSLGLDVPDD